MTVGVSARCAARQCPGLVDRDGFCRKWGHECLPDAPPIEREEQPEQRERHWERTGEHPWEQAVLLPATRVRDPLDALQPGPVAPSARVCVTCARPARETEGFCENCGTAYSFWPPLEPGSLVNGRYLVKGCVGYGGVGWVFLARDRIMDDAWRVLKGLRNPDDKAAADAFFGERRTLISHNHRRIVAILDVVPGEHAAGGPYLVMEYIPGGTLEDARGRPGTPRVPKAVNIVQALGFGDQILDAFEFLHERGLLYCDLKPENVMRVPAVQNHDPDPIRLIDFGAVRRIDDRVNPPWYTPGFVAPEVVQDGPRGTGVRSDLYTVGRTLIALTLTDDTGGMETRFPSEERLLARVTGANLPSEVYLRLLDRATAPDADHRFASAAEMREQLQGVLRQLRAEDTGEPEPARSTVFSPSACAFALHVDQRDLDLAGLLRQLPMPLVNRSDPAAAFLASLGPDSEEVLAQLREAPGPSDGVFFRTVRAHLAVAVAASTERSSIRAHRAETEIARAEKLLADRPENHQDWALWWHRGLIALVAGRATDARRQFDQAFGWLPGEVSARLAYAVAAELCGDVAAATEHYGGVWAADRGVVAAGYGYARCLLTTGADGLGAVERAARVVEQLPVSDDRTAAELDTIGFAVGHFGDRLPAGGRMFGVEMTGAALGTAFEQRCRRLAARTSDRRLRVRLVDAANRLRPVSWW
ncbi:serine/threonine-protein kinase [Winogradskya consettensis]|uniref:non-specific serine/threonine protein kinase n=1 Tax=Winogradskya consettensis TaxID=113560 RepID=A0A919SDQ1_9ACTN|nr:serine/threonine-protein kinase [Actinoplanes consettensis]GIM69860.1 serine/threonine-protein kinase PknG [Actinoplanes consettensis]